MTTQSLPDWAPGRVVASTTVAHDVRRITIACPPRGRAAPGSHVDVRVPLGDATDVRSYSVVESDDDGGLITISVLRVPQSRGGSVFMHGLAPGDELSVTQPLLNFPLRVGAPRYVLLAGGIGITAVAEMARVLRRVGADYTLVYVGRSRERMAYVAELSELHRRRLELHVDAEGTPLDVAGLVGSVGAQAELYMCGPIRLMDDVRHRWQDCGLPPANLRYETFGSSGWFETEEFVARIPSRQVETTVRADETLLEALIRAGVDLMYDCRKGECGLCLLDVDAVDGVLDHRDVFLSAAQKDCGRSLSTCVSGWRLSRARARGRGSRSGCPERHRTTRFPTSWSRSPSTTTPGSTASPDSTPVPRHGGRSPTVVISSVTTELDGSPTGRRRRTPPRAVAVGD